MVGRRGEAPLVPPCKFRRPNKAMALVISLIGGQPARLLLVCAPPELLPP